MDSTIVSYVRALRSAGVDVSVAETMDAASAVALVGYRDRGLLKDTLGAVLAKSPAEKSIHATAFEQFFRLPDAAERSPRNEQAEAGNSSQESGGQASSAGGARAAASAAGGSEDLDVALARAAEAADVDSIRFKSQQGYFVQRMLNELGVDAIDDRIRQLLLGGKVPDGKLAEAKTGDADELARLRATRQELRSAARQVVEHRYELYGRHATETFMQDAVKHRDLRLLGQHDAQRMQALIDRMARRMAVRYSRRRRVATRGRLDFRRILRSSSASDGVPHKIHFKTTRRDKPKFVVICDVSGSVAGHVRFLLWLLHSLHGSIADIRSFAFASDIGEVTDLMERLPFDDAMAQVLADFTGSTDYGRSLEQLQDTSWDSIDRRTTVIILGDGRSNHADPRTDILAEIADRAKRVLWLCPEPHRRWGTGDSCMLQYRSFCTLATHVANLVDLERAIDEALSAY